MAEAAGALCLLRAGVPERRSGGGVGLEDLMMYHMVYYKQSTREERHISTLLLVVVFRLHLTTSLSLFFASICFWSGFCNGYFKDFWIATLESYRTCF